MGWEEGGREGGRGESEARRERRRWKRDRGRHHTSDEPIKCACPLENGTHPCPQLVAVALQKVGVPAFSACPGSRVEEEQRQGDDDDDAEGCFLCCLFDLQNADLQNAGQCCNRLSCGLGRRVEMQRAHVRPGVSVYVCAGKGRSFHPARERRRRRVLRKPAWLGCRRPCMGVQHFVPC